MFQALRLLVYVMVELEEEDVAVVGNMLPYTLFYIFCYEAL